MARAGARSKPSVTSRDRGLIDTGRPSSVMVRQGRPCPCPDPPAPAS
jgi:hypothetical protein